MAFDRLSMFNVAMWLLVGVAIREIHASRVISSDGEIGIAGEEAKDDSQSGLGVVIRPEGEIEQATETGLGVVIRPEGEIEPATETESSESSWLQHFEQDTLNSSSSGVNEGATATIRGSSMNEGAAATITAYGENSSGVSGHLEEALIELVSLVNDTSGSPQSPGPVVSPVTIVSPGDATQRLAQRLGIPTENSCLRAAEGSYMGCTAGCRCGWTQQCYPKYVYIDSAGTDHAALRVDVGTCETAMFVLIFISVSLFVVALAAVFACRLYFEWREKISLGLEEAAPRLDKSASSSASVSRRISANGKSNPKHDRSVRAASKRKDVDDGAAISGAEASGSGGAAVSGSEASGSGGTPPNAGK